MINLINKILKIAPDNLRSKSHGYNYRIFLSCICFFCIFVVLSISILHDFAILIKMKILMGNIYLLISSLVIMTLIYLQRRFGIYLGFFFSFYYLYIIISDSIRLNKIKLPEIFISIFLILSAALLIPVVIKDTKYSPPEDINDDPQTLLLEFFFFFMILGVIGFCLILLQK